MRGASRRVTFRSAFADLEIRVLDQMAEGDRVLTRWVGTGTHTGELTGIPPTGKSVTATGMNLARIANGRVVEEWNEYDQLSLLQQLGAVPAQPGG